jgi:transcriptional regulator with XRE-family HTH domain
VSDPKSVTWLRPEYRGREDELISLAAGAALVGVSRSAVSNWAKRHANFPKIALLTGIGDRRMKYVPRSEFLDFARVQLNKKRGSGRPTAPRRPAALIRAEEIAHAERQIARLTELEARQAETLANTRRALRKHKARLEHARQCLAEEVTAVHHLEYAEGRSRADPTASPDGHGKAG